MIKTMRVAAGGSAAVMADYREIGGQIEIVKVYRAGSGHVFTEPEAVSLAIHAIQGVKAGWLKIGEWIFLMKM